MKKMSAQSRCAAEIVCNHGRPFNTPMCQHGGKGFALHVKRCALIGVFLGLAVAGHVVQINAKTFSEAGDHPVPGKGRPGPAMRKNERRTVAGR